MHYSVLNPYGEGNNLQCGKMMCYHYNVLGDTLRQTLFNEVQTEVMHMIILFCLEQFAIIHYLPKIIHSLPYKIFIGRRDLRP